MFGLIGVARNGGQGAAALALPSGAIGIWYADQYQSTPRRAIPNAASTAAVSQNLASAPRRLFNRTEFYQLKTSTTVTDEAAAGPDGRTYAASIAGTGNSSFVKTVVFTAGTYTVSLDVKRNTGSDQTFRFGRSSALATKTATSSWATVTETFTVNPGASVNIWLAGSPDGSTAVSILIDNFRIHAGSSDLGADVLDTTPHLYLGASHFDTNPAVTSNALDVSTAGITAIQFLDSTTLTSFTAIAVGKRSDNSANIESYLSSITGYSTWSPQHKLAAAYGGPNFQLGAAAAITKTGVTEYAYTARLWDPISTRHQITTCRYDGTTADMFLGDVKLPWSTTFSRTATAKDVWVGLSAGTTHHSEHQYAALVLYNRALSDAEVRQAVAALKARTTAIGLTADFTRFLCAEGDSITNGGSGPVIVAPYPLLFADNSSPQVHGIKVAVGGAVLNGAAGTNSMYGRQARNNAMLPTDKAGRTFIFSFMVGHNDYTGTPAYAANPTQYAADVGAFALAQKNAGWDKVVMGTIPPSSVAGFNTWRNVVNGIYRGTGWAAAHGIDAIYDFDDNPTIGSDAAGSDTAIYSDGTHGTDAFHTAAEVLYRAAINSV